MRGLLLIAKMACRFLLVAARGITRGRAAGSTGESLGEPNEKVVPKGVGTGTPIPKPGVESHCRSRLIADARSVDSVGIEPLLEEALGHIREHQWGRAQRALERAVRADGHNREAGQYLSEVRAVRRCLRQLEKWPRDASLHLDLGRLYFGLELGDEALVSLLRAVELNPDLPHAHHLLAMEYLYRGEGESARHHSRRAHQLKLSLPDFEALQREFAAAGGQHGEGGVPGRNACA